MPYTVKVDHPDAGDQDVYIHGLGTFRNGTSTDVDDEQAELYRAHNAVQTQVHTEDGGLQVTSELGPPLEELDSPWVTVTKAGSRSKKASEEKGGEE